MSVGRAVLPLVAWTVALGLSIPLGPDAMAAVAVAAGLFGVGALVVGVRRHRPADPAPWRFFTAALVAFLVAGGITELFPATGLGPGDLLDAIGYLCLIAGGAVLVRRRNPGGRAGRSAVIDSFVVVGGVGAAIWVFVLVPWISDGDASVLARAITVGFSVLSLTFSVQIARLAIGPGVRNTSYYLLAVGACASLSADAVAALTESGAIGAWGESWVSIAAGIAFAAAGASALHPSMVEVTDAATTPEPAMTSRRLVLLTGCVLTPTGLLLIAVPEARQATVLVVVIAWAVLSVLVLARLRDLALRSERAARIERALRTAAAELVTATDRTTTVAAALRAAAGLSLDDPDGGAELVWSVGADWTATSFHGGGWRSVDADHELVLAAQASRIAGRPVEVDGAGEPGPARVVAALTARDRLTGAIALVARDPAADLVAALAGLASAVSLALEAVEVSELRNRAQGEQRFQALIEQSRDLFVVLDAEGTVTFASPAASRFLGEGADVGRSVLDLMHDDDRAALDRRSLEGDITVRLWTAQGWRRVEATVTALRRSDDPGAFVVNARDVTERWEAEQHLARQEARFRSLVQNSSDFIAVIDEGGQVAYVAPNSEALVGVPDGQLVGQSIRDLVTDGDVTLLLWALASEGTLSGEPFELHMRVGDDPLVPFEVRLTDLRHDAAVGGIVLNARDISERKRLESDLRYRALHDALTGLANRRLFDDRLKAALREQVDDEFVTVAFIDLDDFKTINDTVGHSTADGLLRQVALTLNEAVGESETAARLGGDEFALLLRRPASEGMAVVEAIVGALRYRVDETNVRAVSASAGLATVRPGPDAAAENVLRNADLAMYLAKSRGKGRVEVFDESTADGLLERLRLRVDLPAAVERDEIDVHYQPVVRIEDGHVVALEALARWTHPELGPVGPGEFIPLAEETGVIVSLGHCVLRRAISDVARRWPGPEGPTVNVNLSVRQLLAPGCAAQIGRMLDRYGLPPSRLTVELTESSATDDATIECLYELQALGVGVAADDFGTGYATYAALQRLPFDTVKIDRSLVAGLEAEEADRASVQLASIVDMCHSLGLKTVAEGVEQPEALERLRELGFQFAQGYLLGRPAPLADVAELVDSLSVAVTRATP